MKSWASLTVLCGVLSAVLIQAVPNSRDDVGFRPGMLYRYLYTADVTVGLPTAKRNATGFQLSGTTYVVGLQKNNIILYFDAETCVVSQTKGMKVETSECEALDRMKENLLIPVYSKYYKGVVSEMKVHDKDHRESVNFKKHLLSQLQVQLHEISNINARTNEALYKIGAGEELPLEFEVYEDGIGGTCKTVYRHDEYQEHKDETYKVVDKIRWFDDCLTRNEYHNDNFEDCDHKGCPQKRYAQLPTPHGCGQNRTCDIQESHSVSRYLISTQTSPLELRAIETTSKTTLLGHTKELATTMRVRFEIIESKEDNTPEPNMIEIEKDLQPAFWDEGEDTDDEIEYFKIWNVYAEENTVDQIVEDIKYVAEKIETGEVKIAEDVGNTTLRIIDGIATLTTAELKELFKIIMSSNRIGYEKELFLQALPLSGSSKAAMFIKELVNGQVSVSEAKEMVEAVPDHLYNVTEEVITAYSELCQLPKVKEDKRLFASVCLAYGKLIRALCRNCELGVPSRSSKFYGNAKHVSNDEVFEQRLRIMESGRLAENARNVHQKRRLIRTNKCLSEEFIKEQMQKVASWLKEAKTFNERVVLITTLGQIGIEDMLPILEPYISRAACQEYQLEENECNLLRRTALYNLHNANYTQYYHKFQAIVFSIFTNVSECDKDRIAAFTLIMAKTIPTVQLYDEIVVRVQKEPSRQVKAFVMTTLQNIAKCSIPSHQRRATYAKRSLARLPKHVMDMNDTYSITSDFYDKLKEFGAILHLRTIRNQTGGIVEGQYFNLQYHAGELINKLIKLAFDSEGLTKTLEEILSFKKEVQQSRFSKFGRQKDIIKTLNSMEDFKLLLFSEIFHTSTISTWEKQDVLDALKIVEKLLESLTVPQRADQEQRLFKLFMPVSYQKLVALDIGVPVAMSWRTPFILALKARLFMEPQQKGRYNLSVHINPSVHYSSIRSMHVILPTDEYPAKGKKVHMGCEVDNSFHFSMPANISLEVQWDGEYVNTTARFEPAMNRDLYIHKQSVKSLIISPEKQKKYGTVLVLPEPLRFNATFGQGLLGFNFTFNSTGEDLHSRQPLYTFDTVETRGILSVLVGKLLHPEYLEEEDDIFASIWKFLHPDYLNNEVTIGLWDNTETWTRGYLLNVVYKHVDLNKGKGRMNLYQPYGASSEGLEVALPGENVNIDKLVGELVDETMETLQNMNVNFQPEELEKLKTSSIQNWWIITLSTIGPKPFTYHDHVVTVHEEDYSINLFGAWAYTNRTEVDGELRPLACVRGHLIVPPYEKSIQGWRDLGYFYLIYGRGSHARRCVCPDECVDTNLVIKATMRQIKPYSVPLMVKQGKNCLQAVALGQREPESCLTCLLNKTTIEDLYMTIQYKNLPEEIVNATKRAELHLIQRLYPSKMDIRVRDPPETPGRIVVRGKAREIVPYVTKLDVAIEKPTERIVIKDHVYFEPLDQNCLEPPCEQ